MLKDHGLSAAVATATSDSTQDESRKRVAELRVLEAEQRLGKHR